MALARQESPAPSDNRALVAARESRRKRDKYVTARHRGKSIHQLTHSDMRRSDVDSSTQTMSHGSGAQHQPWPRSSRCSRSSAKLSQAWIKVLQQQQLVWKQQQRQPPGRPARTAQNSASWKQQQNASGFEKIEVFTGGKEQWQNWSRKVITAVTGMCGDLKEMMKSAEAREGQRVHHILNEKLSS